MYSGLRYTTAAQVGGASAASVGENSVQQEGMMMEDEACSVLLVLFLDLNAQAELDDARR